MSWALCKVWNVFSGCLWQTRELNPVYILAHQRQPENAKTTSNTMERRRLADRATTREVSFITPSGNKPPFHNKIFRLPYPPRPPNTQPRIYNPCKLA